jgi:hypothetical protein
VADFLIPSRGINIILSPRCGVKPQVKNSREVFGTLKIIIHGDLCALYDFVVN